MKKHIFTLILVLPLLAGCFDDKGNYEYKDLGEITVTGIPAELELLSYLDRITVSPTITSSIEGDIAPSNENYTVHYKLGRKGMGRIIGEDGVSRVWLDFEPNPSNGLDIPADYGAGTYICWMTVTDNRNGVVTSHFFDVKIATTTYEGWLVLCNEGAEERVRLDMISKLSSSNIVTIHDIAAGLPEIHHATQLGFYPTQASPGDRLYIFSEEGSYLLANESLESSELNEFNLNSFVTPPGGGTETITAFTSMAVTGDYAYMIKHSFAFSDAGNVYSINWGSGGAVFELPINTSKSGTAPEYRVAPFAGFSEVRQAPSGGNGTAALLYDIDNKRFVGFSTSAYQLLTPVPDPPTGMLFSYQTGRDLVYMEGTRRSNGLVYAILQDDAGRRSICAVNMGGNGFVQEGYYENVDAPAFEQTTQFAFHSQYPVMFYATSDKVYLYNLGTETAYDITSTVLGGQEEVTLLKFNLIRESAFTNLNNQTEEFLNLQYQLIVGTYDPTTGDGNGGKVALYDLDAGSNSVSKAVEYDGFAKVVDVVYRTRR